MTAGTLDFVHSTNPEPHRARTKEILRRHPEIRELIGPNPMTLFWTAFVVAIQAFPFCVSRQSARLPSRRNRICNIPTRSTR